MILEESAKEQLSQHTEYTKIYKYAVTQYGTNFNWRSFIF